MTTPTSAPNPSTARLKLHLSTPFRSLKKLPDVELPSLTILTGVNGVGKTHLLKAIKDGAISIEAIPPSEIIYFDWSSLYNLSSTKAERLLIKPSHSDLRRAIETARNLYAGSLEGSLSRLNIQSESNPWVTLRSHPDIWDNKEIVGVFESAERHALHTMSTGKAVHAFALSLTQDARFILLDDREIENINLTHSVGGQAMTVTDLGKVMMAYFELDLFNKLCQLDQSEGRTPELEPLSAEEFVRVHGPPPWTLLSEVLQQLGLDFEITGPRSYSSSGFTPTVRNRGTGETINLEHLSSGEKMLMALAVSTYASTTNDVRANDKTKLVLLDEIDAPLHPSMTRTMLSIIQETLIDRLGCSVILATHSPTTVAIAPEESIHVMRPDRPGVERLSREQAVRLLTAELPTLSLDFTGRRQVFVESAYDAQRYEALYQAFKDRLDSPFSLSFIGSGSKGGEEGGGCQAVQEVVNMLRKHGNRSVWGLIDWDSKNDGNKHVHVLAPGRRYSIENCLLDPLLVVALICDANSGVDRRKLGVRPGEGMGLLLAETAKTRRQELIIQVQRLILEERFAEAPTEEVAYGGGFSHEVSQAYLRFRGHDLTKRALDAFKSLRKHRGEPELLLRAVHILEQHRGLMPLDLLKALQRLASPSPSDPALD